MSRIGITIIIAILVGIFGPFAMIMALNTLFELYIPYTGKTWIAAWTLMMLVNINK